MSINRDTVEHVARLAHVGVMPHEVDNLAAELSTVLEHVARLQSVDTSGIPPTAFAVTLENVMREDNPSASWPLAWALANAPHQHDGYFQVQAVFDD